MRTLLSIVLLVLFLISSLPAQKNIYVDGRAGKNSSPGTFAQPVQSIQQAIDISAPGDTIEIRGGYYFYKKGVQIDKNDLTLRSFAGEWAVIETPLGKTNAIATISFEPGVKGGTLDGLEIIGGEFYGVLIASVFDNRQATADDVLSSGITIRNCRIHDTGRDGLKLAAGSFDLVVEDCEIYRTGVAPGNINGHEGAGIDAINCRNLSVRACYIHHTWAAGITARGGSSEVLFENNLIMDTGAYGLGSGDYTPKKFYPSALSAKLFQTVNHTIRNNIVINTGLNNLPQVACKGKNSVKIASTKNLKLYNNTFVNAAPKGGNELAIPLFIFNVPVDVNNEDLLIVNNIFYQPKGSGNTKDSVKQMVFLESSLEGDSKIDHNLYYHEDGDLSFGRWNKTLEDFERLDFWQNRGFDRHSLIQRPQFIHYSLDSIYRQGYFDRVNGVFDVRLAKGSPAIGNQRDSTVGGYYELNYKRGLERDKKSN